MTTMKQYDFTVILSDVPKMTDEIADKLHEAGCDDASYGSSQGISHVTFHRNATSLQDAIRSAISSVQKAGFHVSKVELDEEDIVQMMAS